MKGARSYLAGAVVAVLLSAFVYLFSFPVLLWAMVQTGSATQVNIRHLISAYRPVFWLSAHCAPYRTILVYEHEQLGLDSAWIYGS